jgi:hypothetical protein
VKEGKEVKEMKENKDKQTQQEKEISINKKKISQKRFIKYKLMGQRNIYKFLEDSNK